MPIKKSVQPDYIVCLDDGKSSRASSVTSGPSTTSPRTNTGPSGACLRPTPWWLRTTPRPGPNWPREWDWDSSVADQSLLRSLHHKG